MQSLPKTLDKSVVNAIVGAMQQNRADRTPSVEAFLASLHDGGEAVCEVDADTAPTRIIASGRKSRKPLWIVLASVAAAIGVVSASVVYYGDEAVVVDTVAPADDYYDEPAAADTAAEW